MLVSGIAHEINNPNSFIVFNLPILKEYTQKLLPIVDEYAQNQPNFRLFNMSYQEFQKDIFKLLDNLEHGAHRISATVYGLQRFTRRRHHEGQRMVDIRKIIEKGVAICHSEIKKMVKSFEINIDPRLSTIFTDPEAIEQILINLLINAAQASDKENSWIRLSVASGKNKNDCVVEVRDNGCGMGEKVRKKIFEPFFTTKTSVGTGLGLYVCSFLIASLGGTIEVESEPGQGSLFCVTLHNVKQH